MNLTLENRIDICEKLRIKTADVFADIFLENKNFSEIDFKEKLLSKLGEDKNILKSGWYTPPPSGVAALFGPSSDLSRLLFKTLRVEEFWPRADCVFGSESVGLVYASPVDVASGIIRDFGVTVYNGQNKKIQEHLVKCLAVLEKVAEFVEVGITLGDVYNQSEILIRKYGLKRSPIILQNNSAEFNIGHTVPFSYEEQTGEEQAIIKGVDSEQIKNLIAQKRVFVNPNEAFKIPATIALTVEIRIKSDQDLTLPNTFFHIMVCFINGEKKILGNFNPVFKAVGMDFIKSKY